MKKRTKQASGDWDQWKAEHDATEARKRAKAKANPLEKMIEAKVCGHAKEAAEMLAYKFTSPAKRSVPDRVFYPKNKPSFLIEFKRRGEVPTDSQEIEINKIRQQGTLVFVIDNVDDGKRLIDLIHAGRKVTPAPGFAQGFMVAKSGCAACDRGDYQLGHAHDCIKQILRREKY